MRLAGFDRPPQRVAGAEQMGLADDISENTRPQTLRERRCRLGGFKKFVHPDQCRLIGDDVSAFRR